MNWGSHILSGKQLPIHTLATSSIPLHHLCGDHSNCAMLRPRMLCEWSGRRWTRCKRWHAGVAAGNVCSLPAFWTPLCSSEFGAGVLGSMYKKHLGVYDLQILARHFLAIRFANVISKVAMAWMCFALLIFGFHVMIRTLRQNPRDLMHGRRWMRILCVIVFWNARIAGVFHKSLKHLREKWLAFAWICFIFFCQP